MKQSVEVPSKKPYQPPKLLIYGNLTQMTGKGMVGHPDGAMTGLNRRTG